MPTTRNWLRAGILVATLAPLVMIGVIAGFSEAQPPGGMPRNGPPMPRGNPNFPGSGQPNFPGGNPTSPNMPNNPGGDPNFPGNTPPSFPGGSPPNYPGNMPGNMPSMPNMPGPPEMVWTCGACGKEVGRGPFKPELANCPFCGVRINNTIAGQQADSQDRANNMTNRPSAPPYSGPSGPASSSAGSSGAPRVAAAFWIVALVVVGVIVVIIAVAIAGAVMLFNTTPKPRRVRMSRRYRDDY